MCVCVCASMWKHTHTHIIRTGPRNAESLSDWEQKPNGFLLFCLFFVFCLFVCFLMSSSSSSSSSSPSRNYSLRWFSWLANHCLALGPLIILEAGSFPFILQGYPLQTSKLIRQQCWWEPWNHHPWTALDKHNKLIQEWGNSTRDPPLLTLRLALA